MKNKHFVLLALAFFVSCIVFAGCAAKKITHEDIQQLDHAKNIFESQIENDRHPVIWMYLDEVLHDPYSFRLQRYEYQIGNYPIIVPYEHKLYWFGDQTEMRSKEVTMPAYHILMRFRVRVPSGGYMLKEMSFYLLKDKTLRLPNGQFVSILN